MWITIASVYIVMSGLTFVAYWRDKRAAARNAWRTPEVTLHMLELLGGWPGALLGQRFLHHKNRKASYRLALVLIIALNVAAWSAYWWWHVRSQR